MLGEPLTFVSSSLQQLFSCVLTASIIFRNLLDDIGPVKCNWLVHQLYFQHIGQYYIGEELIRALKRITYLSLHLKILSWLFTAKHNHCIMLTKEVKIWIPCTEHALRYICKGNWATMFDFYNFECSWSPSGSAVHLSELKSWDQHIHLLPTNCVQFYGHTLLDQLSGILAWSLFSLSYPLLSCEWWCWNFLLLLYVLCMKIYHLNFSLLAFRLLLFFTSSEVWTNFVCNNEYANM